MVSSLVYAIVIGFHVFLYFREIGFEDLGKLSLLSVVVRSFQVGLSAKQHWLHFLDDLGIPAMLVPELSAGALLRRFCEFRLFPIIEIELFRKLIDERLHYRELLR